MRKQIMMIIIGVMSLGSSLNLTAAEFCATTSAELESALLSADNNGQSDSIKIAEGVYDAPIGGFNFNSFENFDIEISGGWREFFGNPCGQILSGNAFNTVLDGMSTERALYVRVQGDADVEIRNLFFANGLGNDLIQRGGGLLVNGVEGYVGDILIENNAFLNNSAQFGGAISFFRGDRVTIRNNLITINHSVAGSAVEAVSNDVYGLIITNNTIYLNTSDSTSDLNASGLYVAVNGLSQALIINNIIWGNDNKDLRLGGNGNKYLKYNNVEFIQGAASVEIGNFPDQPVFEPGFFSYTPQYNSPLVEGGIKPPTIIIIPVPFQSNWSLGDSDMAGDPRVQYNKVDIGAFESPHGDLIFIDGFE